MASSYQDLLTEVWDAIEADSGTSFVAAQTPFSAELIPATMQGREFVAVLRGGGPTDRGASTTTIHSLVVSVLADTRIPKTGQGIALSYVTAIVKILAGAGTDILGNQNARAVYQDYEIEPVNDGEWAIVRCLFEVHQTAALES